MHSLRSVENSLCLTVLQRSSPQPLVQLLTVLADNRTLKWCRLWAFSISSLRLSHHNPLNTKQGEPGFRWLRSTIYFLINTFTCCCSRCCGWWIVLNKLTSISLEWWWMLNCYDLFVLAVFKSFVLRFIFCYSCRLMNRQSWPQRMYCVQFLGLRVMWSFTGTFLRIYYWLIFRHMLVTELKTGG